MCLDEVGSKGACYKESDFLKSAMTKNYRKKEKKFIDGEQGKDYTRYFLFTNNNWIVRVDNAYDRRYFCLDCSNEFANNFTYFTNLYNFFTKESGLHFFHYLINEVDISDWKWHQIPMTDWKMELVVKNLNNFDKTLTEFIRIRHDSQVDRWHSIEFFELYQTVVPEKYREFRSENLFARAFYKHCGLLNIDHHHHLEKMGKRNKVL